jgi:hypothetical protein
VVRVVLGLVKMSMVLGRVGVGSERRTSVGMIAGSVGEGGGQCWCPW